MWAVAKIKKKELNIFKKKLSEQLNNNIQFYYPKIQLSKNFKNKVKKSENLVLENYVFCYCENFNKIKSFSNIKFIKGLDYFLGGHLENQVEITSFINYCKSFENKEGYLTQGFFKESIKRRAKFISGPFTNMMFEIIEKQKNKLKILIGNVVTTISDKKNYLYRPI
tara:strand:- start:1770 stop:2270 length:501 start_codon:yes stop_codon:yes gene_type:complete